MVRHSKHKIPILILGLIIFNVIFLVFANILVDGNKFVFSDGTYSYSDLFYTDETDRDLYTYSRAYYDLGEEKYIPLKNLLENAEFEAVSSVEASAILTFFSNKDIWGYCRIVNTVMFASDFTDEEFMTLINGHDYVVIGRFFDFMGKSYMYTVFKDESYEYDESLSVEKNYLNSVLDRYNHSIALFEIRNHDMDSMKPSDNQRIVYDKYFNNILIFPHSILFWSLIFVEIVFIYRKIKDKRKTGNGSSS